LRFARLLLTLAKQPPVMRGLVPVSGHVASMSAWPSSIARYGRMWCAISADMRSRVLGQTGADMGWLGESTGAPAGMSQLERVHRDRACWMGCFHLDVVGDGLVEPGGAFVELIVMVGTLVGRRHRRPSRTDWPRSVSAVDRRGGSDVATVRDERIPSPTSSPRRSRGCAATSSANSASGIIARSGGRLSRDV
jgi:hypothetical protein